MTAPYLPKVATLEQALAWLEHETSQQWPLARLIEETAIMPWVWLDYSPGAPPEVFAGRLEGYLAPLLFAGDTQRLAAGADDVVITMTETADGRLFQTVGMRCPLSELRFMADDLRENVRATNKTLAKKNVHRASTGQDWKEDARAIADELFDNDSRNKCRDSLDGYSKRVRNVMQERKIHGPRGLIDNHNTIKRDALQGQLWWAKKSK